MMKTSHISALCVAVLLSTFQLSALAADAVEVKTVAEHDVSTVSNGKKQVRRVPVDKAVPGEEIIYTTTFKNQTGKPAGNIAITNPVPNDSIYKVGSAVGVNTVIAFSVDGGKIYAAPDQLTVKTKEGAARPAQPADYTHIRWTYKGELGAGKSGSVSFRAIIK